MATGSEEWKGGIDWKFGVDMYTWLYFKLNAFLREKCKKIKILELPPSRQNLKNSQNFCLWAKKRKEIRVHIHICL